MRGKAHSMAIDYSSVTAGFSGRSSGASGAMAARFCILDGPTFGGRNTYFDPADNRSSAARELGPSTVAPLCVAARCARGDYCNFADAVSRRLLGSRLRVPSRLVDGRGRPVARRSSVSAMGRVGKLGIRRAAVCLLPAGILDRRRGAWFGAALEDGADDADLADADRGGNGDVEARARILPRSAGSRGSRP